MTPLALALGIAVALAGCAAGGGPSGAEGSARAVLVETPEWGQPGALSVREAADGRLLLRLDSRPAVYAVDPGRRTAAAVGEAAWEAAGGPTADCEAAAGHGPVLSIDADGRLLDGDRRLPTAEPTALSYAVRPDGGAIAVLSAAGRRGSLLPALGAGGGEGRHVHEVLALPSFAAVGGPVALPLGGPDDPLAVPCWSPSGRYVLYPDLVFSRLAVVGGASD